MLRYNFLRRFNLYVICLYTFFFCHPKIPEGLGCSLGFELRQCQPHLWRARKEGGQQTQKHGHGLNFRCRSHGRSPCLTGVVTALGGPSQQHHPSLLLLLLEQQDRCWDDPKCSITTLIFLSCTKEEWSQPCP